MLFIVEYALPPRTDGNERKEKIAISKNNKIETVIISIDEYERLKEAEEYMKKNP